MQSYEIRLGILSALLGGILVASLGALAFNSKLVRAANLNPEPESTAILVASPEVSVPGYFGPLYNSRGNIIALSVEDKKSAFAPIAGNNGAVRTNRDRSTSKSVVIVPGTSTASGAAAESSFDHITSKNH